jgi:hypothetical protein
VVTPNRVGGDAGIEGRPMKAVRVPEFGSPRVIRIDDLIVLQVAT